MATFRGTGRNDSIVGGDSADNIYGGNGRDTLHGGDGSDRVDGQSGNDWIDGGYGSDTVVGGDGNDTMSPGFAEADQGGNDAYYPGQGNDWIGDQYGADRFVFERPNRGGFGEDVLTGAGNFDGSGDRIEFAGYSPHQVQITSEFLYTNFHFSDGSNLQVTHTTYSLGNGQYQTTLVAGQDYFFV